MSSGLSGVRTDTYTSTKVEITNELWPDSLVLGENDLQK